MSLSKRSSDGLVVAGGEVEGFGFAKVVGVTVCPVIPGFVGDVDFPNFNSSTLSVEYLRVDVVNGVSLVPLNTFASSLLCRIIDRESAGETVFHSLTTL